MIVFCFFFRSWFILDPLIMNNNMYNNDFVLVCIDSVHVLKKQPRPVCEQKGWYVYVFFQLLPRDVI